MLKKILLYFIFPFVFVSFVNSNAIPTVKRSGTELTTVTVLPSVDIAFKNVFGIESNKKVLIHFLNSILKREDDPITDLRFLNTEIPASGLYEKLSRLDVLVQTSSREMINIEIQVRNAGSIVDRSMYYASKMISKSLSSGQSYQSLPKFIMINLLGYRAFDDERPHRTVALMDTVSNERYTDKLELHFFELQKYGDRISNLEEAWIAFLKNPNNDFAIGTSAPQEMTQARETLLMLQKDRTFCGQYDQRNKDMSDQNSAIEYARKAERIGIVQRMKADGSFSIKQIAEITGLTEEEVQAI